MLFVVTIAVKLPAVLGFLENATVNEVGLEAVTVPMAPLLKVTVLRDAMESKPNPSIVRLLALGKRIAVPLVTTGTTVPTCIAVTLLTPLAVIIAVRLPAEMGLAEKATVNSLDVAAVTVPTAPLLKITVLLLPVVSKPNPAIVMVAASAAKLLVLLVTIGLTVAT